MYFIEKSSPAHPTFYSAIFSNTFGSTNLHTPADCENSSNWDGDGDLGRGVVCTQPYGMELIPAFQDSHGNPSHPKY